MEEVIVCNKDDDNKLEGRKEEKKEEKKGMWDDLEFDEN
jgi:hypothetical protein